MTIATAPGQVCRLQLEELAACYAGMVPYGEALALQTKLAGDRIAGRVADTLLLLQHPHVFTTGRFRGAGEVTVPRERLRRQGISVVHTARGGSITYHGPGQLVAYIIFDLNRLGIGVREFVGTLEQSVIALLSALGVEGRQVPGFRGVWVGDEKICSIGISVDRGVTMHGFALNVSTDLSYFGYINPCGLKGCAMTSVSRVLGREVACEDVAPLAIDSVAISFGARRVRRMYEPVACMKRG